MRCFAQEARLILDPAALAEVLSVCHMKGGSEHRVALMPEEGRVIKDADAHALATESVYDYLTDLLLSNHFFEDDLQLLGCYDAGGRLHIVTSQPYVLGIHPEWPELKAGFINQGLDDPEPNSLGGTFVIHTDLAGDIDVIDLKCNNVILDTSGRMNPIDAHFYFDDRASRVAVLKSLGLDAVAGPTDLNILMEDNESDFFKP